MRVVRGDLNGELPSPDETFDVVTSNQANEHLHDTDTFVGAAGPSVLAAWCSCRRRTWPWHNIAALTLGWQAFSLTPASRARQGLGNPWPICGTPMRTPSTAGSTCGSSPR